jgi:uncharacterized protein YqeY
MDINKYIKEAMLAKDSVRLSSLRAIKSAFLVAQTEKGACELDDASKQKIIQKQVKQRKDAATIYLEQNRQDLADDELAQVAILEEFLPEQLSEDEILTESLANMASLMYLLISMTSQRYRVRNYWALFQYFYHRLLQEHN